MIRQETHVIRDNDPACFRTSDDGSPFWELISYWKIEAEIKVRTPEDC